MGPQQKYSQEIPVKVWILLAIQQIRPTTGRYAAFMKFKCKTGRKRGEIIKDLAPWKSSKSSSWGVQLEYRIVGNTMRYLD